MKRAFISLFFFVALASAAVGQNETDWFKTVWLAPASGSITFPAQGSGYTIRYVRIDPVTEAPIGTMQTISPATAGQVISGLTSGWTYRIDAYGGTFNQLSFWGSSTSKDDIVAVKQWGTTVWSSMESTFFSCENMDVTATDVPNLTNVTNMSNMFNDCRKLKNANGSMVGWNTQNVTNMSNMFSGATSFNQPIGNWDTQNVTNMSYMFLVATSFNQPLTNWNTEKVTNMSTMFSRATSFNQPLTNFDTKNVTNMSGMFYGATSFNQPLTNFNTKNVTDMSSMFSGATSFDQPLTNFDTKNVTNMYSMFYGATSFNQPVDFLRY